MAVMEGASLARKFAERYTVALLARNQASYSSVVDEITSNGGHATGFDADVSDPESMRKACAQISGTFPDTRVTAALYNVGGGFMRKPFLALTPEEFKAGYESNALGAFNFSQASIPHLLKSASTAKEKGLEYPPTMIFTGATASIKGSAQVASFASGKFALRALSQSLAREFGPRGIHVAHVIVDGVIDVDHTKGATFYEPDSKLSADAMADTYWQLHSQPRTTWTHELDMRPWVERW